MVIEITEASSVITWDFDVSKGDVVFTIYHSRRAPLAPKKDTLGSHALTSLGTVSVQVIDKSWTLGKDYSMVERALTCNESESVQVRDGMMDDGPFVSHVCRLLRQSGPADGGAVLCLLRAPT